MGETSELAKRIMAITERAYGPAWTWHDPEYRIPSDASEKE